MSLPPLPTVIVALLTGWAAEHLVNARSVPSTAVVVYPGITGLFGLVKGDDPVTSGFFAENARLKKIVAEQALDIDILKEVSRGNF